VFLFFQFNVSAMTHLRTIFCIAIFFVTISASTAQKRKTRLSNELVEVSGLVCTPDNDWWALADSGNEPALYKIDPNTGKTIETRRLPLLNRDWEDLTVSPDGCLWIGDFGNNRNQRKDLKIYRYCPKSGVIDSILFAYPDQQVFPPASEAEMIFDCEAMVFWRDTIHIFTKSRFKSAHPVTHYTIPAQPGRQVATKRFTLDLDKRVVTGAALSPDGRTLALTAYYVKKRKAWLPYTRGSVFYFSDFSGTNYLQAHTIRQRRLPKILISRQFESITYAPNGRYYAANEGIYWQKPRLWRIRS
jgi:hypothetical protein